MVFVSTSLQNAQKRNDMRARKLPAEIVQGDWEKARKNADEFKKLFGRDFVEITNDDDVATLQKKSMSLYSKMLTWTSKYPSNKVALKWKERMLLRKQDGRKNYRQFIKESENQDEGKLVASQLQIISALMSKLKDRAEKELSKNQEKGVAFLNTLGSFVGAKVTDKKQAKEQTIPQDGIHQRRCKC